MDKLGIGELISGTQNRDAIHVAVAPVVAGENLYVGENIGFATGSSEVVVRTALHIGIVDPFLKSRVIIKGERFWMFLYPGSITSMRHDWTHPNFRAMKQLR